MREFKKEKNRTWMIEGLSDKKPPRQPQDVAYCREEAKISIPESLQLV